MNNVSGINRFTDLLASIIIFESWKQTPNMMVRLDSMTPEELKDVYHFLFNMRESFSKNKTAPEAFQVEFDDLDFVSAFYSSYNDLINCIEGQKVDVNECGLLMLIDQAMSVINEKVNSHIYA